MSVTIHIGDCRDVLAAMPEQSVHCIVTSPPYFGLRDYGTAEWEGGDPNCDHLGKPRSMAKTSFAGNGHGNGKPPSPYQTEIRETYRNECRKCGAKRIDRQIGLEASPAAYVEELVAVFREARRVLRDDGTLWLNIGDSYNAYNGNRGASRGEANSRHHEIMPALPRGSGLTVPTLKNKDLIGIPWLVAFALRQPFYSGRIKDERDRVWLAAMLDGEGCFYIHKRPAGQAAGNGYFRTVDNFQCAFEVANTCEALVNRCMEIAGVGSISRQDKDRRQPLFRWTVRSTEAKALIREIYPHLVAKKQQARIAYGATASGNDAEPAWMALKALHSGASSGVDFPEPPSCFEPGWYLRAANIWSKPNPMPESVRDRTTSSYELVFMLSKRARYFYDAEAVKEDLAESTIRIHSSPGVNERGTGADWKQYNVGNGHSGLVNGNLRDGRRNLRNVWTIATQPFPGAHFATMPPKLAETCIKAGTSEKGVCPHCDAPWERVTERKFIPQLDVSLERGIRCAEGQKPMDPSSGWPGFPRGTTKHTTSGWQPSCSCPSHKSIPATVLDPFGGAGTAGLVADRLQRRAILIELSEEYAAIARKRIAEDKGNILSAIEERRETPADQQLGMF